MTGFSTAIIGFTVMLVLIGLRAPIGFSGKTRTFVLSTPRVTWW